MNILPQDLARAAAALLVCPSVCLGCGKYSYMPLCRSCFEYEFPLPVLSSALCGLCGRPLISETGICADCRRNPPFTALDRVFPLFAYGGIKKEMLYMWKLGNLRILSARFAGLLAAAWKRDFSGIPLVPVPPRPGKIREKGWDQIRELSAVLHFCYHIPVLPFLERTAGVPQKTLDREERFKNMRKAFRIKKKYIGKIPDTLMILDDVMTTGATLDSCAAVLRSAGASKIFGLTLFYV